MLTKLSCMCGHKQHQGEQIKFKLTVIKSMLAKLLNFDIFGKVNKAQSYIDVYFKFMLGYNQYHKTFTKLDILSLVFNTWLTYDSSVNLFLPRPIATLISILVTSM